MVGWWCLAGLITAIAASKTSVNKLDSEDNWQVMFVTDKGSIVVEVVPQWAPIGAQRFKEMFDANFFVGAKFFRVVPNFCAQFGLPANPDVLAQTNEDGSRRWGSIKDDPVMTSNLEGTLTFAQTSDPNSRSTQLFFNLDDNNRLDTDGHGFAPFARVVDGLEVLRKINSEYGEEPDQGQISQQGDKYIQANFPHLTKIESLWKLQTQTLESTKQLIVDCKTTKGDFSIFVIPKWAPIGARRFIQLVEEQFFDGSPLFRVLPNFLVQFGINGNPEVHRKFDSQGLLRDDPPNSEAYAHAGVFPRGHISFAGWGPNSRNTNVFIAYLSTKSLGQAPWEVPFGYVSEVGMKPVVDKFDQEYGETDAAAIVNGGNAYVTEHYPNMDSIISCVIRDDAAMLHLVGDAYPQIGAQERAKQQSVFSRVVNLFDDTTVMILGCLVMLVNVFVVYRIRQRRWCKEDARRV